jgi:tol-pal system protein YbgF
MKALSVPSPYSVLALLLLLAVPAAQASLFGSKEDEAFKADTRQQLELMDRKIQALQGAVNDLLLDKEGLRAELREMQGALDQQTHALESVRRQLKDTYVELDRRLKEGASPATPGLDPAAPVGGLPAVPSAPQPALSPVGMAAAAPAPITPAPITPAPITPPPVAPPAVAPTSEGAALPAAPTGGPEPSAALSEKDAYQAAYATLMQQNYPQAADELRRFLARYPNGQYAANAQYWLGEAYYAARNRESALAEFNKVLADYPQSAKVPDAMLKIAYLHLEQQQNAQARQLLEALVRDYPDATASRLAARKLESLP